MREEDERTARQFGYSLDFVAEETVVQVSWHLCDVARFAGVFDASVTAEALLEDGAVTEMPGDLVGEDRSMPWPPWLWTWASLRRRPHASDLRGERGSYQTKRAKWPGWPPDCWVG